MVLSLNLCIIASIHRDVWSEVDWEERRWSTSSFSCFKSQRYWISFWRIYCAELVDYICVYMHTQTCTHIYNMYVDFIHINGLLLPNELACLHGRDKKILQLLGQVADFLGTLSPLLFFSSPQHTWNSQTMIHFPLE